MSNPDKTNEPDAVVFDAENPRTVVFGCDGRWQANEWRGVEGANLRRTWQGPVRTTRTEADSDAAFRRFDCVIEKLREERLRSWLGDPAEVLEDL